MKKIKQSYPRRREMLSTPFKPLSDAEFRKSVTDGLAIPSLEGSVLFVSKWRDGPGMGADEFLTALRAEGSSLEARSFREDVNIRVLRKRGPASSGRRLPAASRVTAA
ncbi:MAG: hypothetical protein L3K02_07880 [Thermoplasmata archaeon]|nr:hypothetical protein [Thermoplasmata archaeon]